MNARVARQRQQLIWNTLVGLKAILVDDTTLLAEMDPDQEGMLKNLVELAIHKGYVEL